MLLDILVNKQETFSVQTYIKTKLFFFYVEMDLWTQIYFGWSQILLCVKLWVIFMKELGWGTRNPFISLSMSTFCLLLTIYCFCSYRRNLSQLKRKVQTFGSFQCRHGSAPLQKWKSHHYPSFVLFSCSLSFIRKAGNQQNPGSHGSWAPKTRVRKGVQT